MSAKVSFNQPLKSLTFCGAENIAALFDNDFRIAWSSTGTHALCGVLEGNESEDIFLVINKLKSSSVEVYGVNAYNNPKGKYVISYQAHQSPTTHFSKYRRDLYASADQDGNVWIQFGDTRAPSMKDAARKLYKENQHRKKHDKSDKGLQGH
ncbi:hypothetical protein GCK72_000830 [Caenorhabditis remanei]|uniref:Uncharacterized protein n=1 Tax=Caenorhabditis remanei TaxID=31234 RepID=A0A6A5HRQ1_CAERE|nr:hypothetical protein GCK72_000830 [Caenorhabditis remanei]KAF1769017.1 hypothetical protein GCK72_000830 [Caenorhabditis remanei]